MILKNQTQPGFFEMEMKEISDSESTKRHLAPQAHRIAIRELILRNTLNRTNMELGSRGGKQEVTLFGAPGYEIMMND